MKRISHKLWMESVIGHDLTVPEAHELFDNSEREKYKRDEKLFDEGEEATSFFLIVSGDVAIEKRDENGRVVLISTLGPGSVIGEMSLLTRERRSASARVQTDEATLLTVDWAKLHSLLERNSQVGYKVVLALARLLAHRLKRINIKVAELTNHSSGIEGTKIEEFAKFKQKLFQDWSF